MRLAVCQMKKGPKRDAHGRQDPWGKAKYIVGALRIHARPLRRTEGNFKGGSQSRRATAVRTNESQGPYCRTRLATSPCGALKLKPLTRIWDRPHFLTRDIPALARSITVGAAVPRLFHHDHGDPLGVLTGFDGPRIAANLPTPLVGVWERVNIGVFLLWVMVLAIALLRVRDA